MNFPSELKYTNDHEWLKIEGDIAYVGVTDFAQNGRCACVVHHVKHGPAHVAILSANRINQLAVDFIGERSTVGCIVICFNTMECRVGRSVMMHADKQGRVNRIGVV